MRKGALLNQAKVDELTAIMGGLTGGVVRLVGNHRADAVAAEGFGDAPDGVGRVRAFAHRVRSPWRQHRPAVYPYNETIAMTAPVVAHGRQAGS